MNRALHSGLLSHRRSPRVLALVATSAALFAAGAGCTAVQSLNAPGGAYVAADRATYGALAPEYAAYVAADPALAPEERDRRTRALQTWRMRIEAAEQAASAPTSQPVGSDFAK